MAALEPYCFEPERVPNNDESERLNNLNWYSWGHCELRETARECICSLEEPESRISENKFTKGTCIL